MTSTRFIFWWCLVAALGNFLCFLDSLDRGGDGMNLVLAIALGTITLALRQEPPPTKGP